MKRIIILMLICILSACAPKIQESELKKEKAYVVQLFHLPDTRSTEVAPGFSTGSGSLTLTIVETGHKEIFGAIFRCEDHKRTFTLLGKDFFDNLTPGQEVTLEYVELYTINDYKQKVVHDYKTKNVIMSKRQ